MLGHQAFLHKFREAEEISGYQLFDWGTVEFKICDKIMYLLNNEDLCPDEVFRDFWQQKKKKCTEVKKKNLPYKYQKLECVRKERCALQDKFRLATFC